MVRVGGAEDDALIVCFPFRGGTVAGSHLSTLLLAEGLENCGVHVLLTVHTEGLLTDELARRGLRWEVVPAAGSSWSNGPVAQSLTIARDSPRLARFLRQRRVDVVHTNDSRMHRLWGVAAHLARCRHVWHQRSLGLSRSMTMLARRADEVIVISDYSRSKLPPSLRSSARLIANPFDVEASPPYRSNARRVLAEELRLPETRAIVAFVSNSQQLRKRPEFFLEVAHQLVTFHGLEAAFPLIGLQRSDLADRIRRKIDSLGLRDHCRSIGPRFPIEPTLAGCDVLIAPAVEEPMGRTLIEAMLVGTPVVAANDGGHAELIDELETGFLFEPDDVAGCANSVLRLLEDAALRKSVTERARDMARRRFSVDRHVTEVRRLYESSMGRAK